MRIVIDQDKCIASGQCVLAADDIFDQQDEDGIVTLLNSAPETNRTEDVHRAVDSCPALAIRIEE